MNARLLHSPGPQRGPKQRQARSLGPDADALIEQCRTARLAANTSQGEIAQRMGGVDRSYVTKVETEFTAVRLPYFIRYAKACGLTVLLVPTAEVEG